MQCSLAFDIYFMWWELVTLLSNTLHLEILITHGLNGTQDLTFSFPTEELQRVME
jgi:hypothetical protein